jgi:NADH-quinone oxidoreductase subunit N
MTNLDFISLIPFIIISTAPVIIMLTVVVTRNFKMISGFSILMLLASFVSLLLIIPYAPHQIAGLVIIDRYALLFLAILYFASILITIFATEYFDKHLVEREEFYIVLFIAILGASILVVSSHFISFFLGLETLSISLYIMIAYLRSRDNCIEAGVKFLVTASVATAFLLFGMGLIYAETGSMNFREIAARENGIFTPLFLAGTGLILAGIGFKLALVPFHMWIPDIYHGAPVPVTTFIATISKGSMLALALRLFTDISGAESHTLILAVSAISILSMFAGNLLGLMQTNIKKLLAYSSVAHLGYLLITLISGTVIGIEAAIFYVVAYIISTLGAFSVISILSTPERDADNIEDVKGLFWTNPFYSILLTLALLSLAGLPLTAGFMSKFYLVLAGLKSNLWVLAVSLIINSAISLFYYLRVVKTMLEPSDIPKHVKNHFLVNLSLIVITAGILLLGLFPSLLMNIISEFHM